MDCFSALVFDVEQKLLHFHGQTMQNSHCSASSIVYWQNYLYITLKIEAKIILNAVY